MKYEVACSFCGHSQIYTPRGERIPKKPHTTCKSCGKDFSIDISISETISRIPKNPKQNILDKSINHQTNNSSQPPYENTFIDDPDELLMSVSIRELNRPNPDPRWASILITTRKENIGQSKKEGKIRSKFMSMNIKEVARISARKLTSTSQKPDFKESS